MGRRINIRPTTSVYATYRNLSYDPWTAIAEFVDNSTQSYYDNDVALRQTKYWKGLNVEIIYSKDAEYGEMLVIKDNASGMDFADFQRAIVLDSPPKKRSRSEFGMGLKTAACWFGMNWSVETTLLGSREKYYAEIDVDLLRKNRNEEIEVQEELCHPKEHGTTIRIWNLNHKIIGRQIGKTKDKLRGIYRIDLRSNDITISYNGEALSFEEPDRLVEQLPDGNSKMWEQPVNFTVVNDEKSYNVNGFIALRNTASTSNAGFALIRFGRVIVGGYENNYRPEEIFEKPNSFIYQRLFGELNMDDWPVTNTKDAFDWYNGLEDAFIDKLNEVCNDYKKKARDYRKTPVPDVVPDINKVAKQFAQTGVFEDVNTPISSNPKKENKKPVVSDNQMKIASYDDSQNKTISTINENQEDDSRRIEFVSNGVTYKLNLLIQKNDPSKNWLHIKKVINEYIIEWNIRHPFFKQLLRDQDSINTMALLILAFSFAEIESMQTSENGKIEPGDIRIKMNEILKKVMGESNQDGA